MDTIISLQDTVLSLQPLLTVLIALLAVPVIIAFREQPNLRGAWTFAAGIVTLLLVSSMVPMVIKGYLIACPVAEILPGLTISFIVDAPGLFFGLVIATLWLATSIYSIGYRPGSAGSYPPDPSQQNQTRSFCFAAIAISAAIGAAFAANLFTLYLFYMTLAAAVYPLSTNQQGENRIAGRRYLTIIMGTALGLLLPAILTIYLLTGTLEFNLQGIMPQTSSRAMVTILFIMFVCGFAMTALMPFHSWLPAVMTASTPVNALLHAVIMVNVGTFSILRVSTGIFGLTLLRSLDLGIILSWIAAFTLITAAIIALYQKDLKRRLAWIVISQTPFLLLGMTLFSAPGMVGGLLQIPMQSFGIITLFFCAGAVSITAGGLTVNEMAGLGRRMPITMTAFLLASFSVIGLPPTGGFLGKWPIFQAALATKHSILLIVMLAGSLLNAAGLLSVCYRAFFLKPGKSLYTAGTQEASAWLLAPLVFSAATSLLLFFFSWPFSNLARLAVQAFTGD